MANGTDDPYDLVILGGGSGGYACALRAAELGMSVALVEKDKVGGTCLHRGCIPTKALLHAAEIADQARNSETFGIKATLEAVDMPAVNAYKDKVVDRLYKGLQGLVRSRRITVVEGEGRLVSPTAVQVGDTVYEGRHIVLATGSEAKALPDLEFDGERIISSDHAVRMDRVPASAVILGGGFIGAEFASLWRSFGAEVTIVEMLPHLVPAEEESSSQALERAFRRRGIRQELGTRLEGATATGNAVTVTLDGDRRLEADVLLVAVGRAPVTGGLGYEDAGVEMERGFVKVDQYCRTNLPTVSALGDLIPTLQLAHTGFGEGIMVAERLAGLNPPPIDYDGVPRITYSEPEVASVGITSATAAERGHEVVTYTYDLAGNGKSQILQTQGAVKVVSAAEGPVLGVHMVGTRVGELAAEAQLITNWEALPAEVAQLVHPHPTQSEAVGEAHLALAGKPLHTHG